MISKCLHSGYTRAMHCPNSYRKHVKTVHSRQNYNTVTQFICITVPSRIQEQYQYQLCRLICHAETLGITCTIKEDTMSRNLRNESLTTHLHVYRLQMQTTIATTTKPTIWVPIEIPTDVAARHVKEAIDIRIAMCSDMSGRVSC